MRFLAVVQFVKKTECRALLGSEWHSYRSCRAMLGAPKCTATRFLECIRATDSTKLWHAALCLILSLGVGCATAQREIADKPAGDPSLTRFEFSQPQMGLPFRIVLYARDRASAEAAANAAFARIAELNGILSDYDSDSELSRLSQTSGTGQEVILSADLWKVLNRAQALAKKTQGAFDVTVGPVVNLWRKARREQRLPDPPRMAEARAAVGFEKLQLNQRRRSARLLAPKMRLDVGAIAKGYAIDEALAVIQAHSLSRALVTGGGDMAAGDPPPGQPGWRITLAAFDATNAPPTRFVQIARVALATSGDAFQRLEIDGKRYSHIVDPRTGLGLTDHSLVTVIARDCITADSLATAVSVLGPEPGLKLISATSGTDVRVVIRPENLVVVHESPGFSRHYPSVTEP